MIRTLLLLAHLAAAQTLFSQEQSVEIKAFVTIVRSKLTAFKKPIIASEEIVITNAFGKTLSLLGKARGFLEVKHPELGTLYLKDKPGDVLVSKGETAYITAMHTEESTIVKKALIINNLRVNPNPDLQVRYYDNPELAGKPRGRVTLFEVRFVFAEFTNAQRQGSAEPLKTMLVCKRDRFVQSRAEGTLVGWINREQQAEWPTRLGLEFNKDNYQQRDTTGDCQELARIYDAQRKLMAKREPIFLEDCSKEPPKYFATRFPVLEFDEVNQSYHIVYIGRALNECDTYDAATVDEAKNRINSLIKKPDVQIAILIDATQGMGKHMGSIKTALERFLTNTGHKLQPRVAVVAYRDYVDGAGLFEIINPFTQDVEELKRNISQISTYSSRADTGDKAFPEAVFHAIHKAQSELAWSAEDGEKFILLIGDHGNHPHDERGYTAATIGHELQQNTTVLYAIQVESSTQSAEFNYMFTDQFSDIQQNNQQFGNLKRVSGSSAQIYNALQGILGFNVKIQNHLLGVRLGKIYPGTFTARLLARYKLNPKLFQAAQVTERGYVKRFQAQTNELQVKETVLMRKTEVEALKVQMDELSRALFFYEPKTEAIFKQTVYKVVKALTNDRMGPDEDIAGFIKKKSGIPIQTKSLRKTLADLMSEVRNRDFRLHFRRELEQKLIGLEEVVRQSIIDYDENSWDPKEQTYSWRDTRREKRYFYDLELPIETQDDEHEKISDNRRNYAWVPLKFIP